MPLLDGPAGLDPFVGLALAAATGDRPGVVRHAAALQSDPAAAAAVLHRHQIGEPALAELRAAGDPGGVAEPLSMAVGRLRRRDPLAPDVAFELYAEARSALERAGIPVLLLKGQALASRLYGGLDRRPQGDIDLLVRRRDRRRAAAALRGLGYRREHRDQHATVLRRNGRSIDLHWALRAAPAYRISERAVWAGAREVMIGQLRVPTLSDEYLLTLLSVGLSEDAGIGMAKLRQLCDLWLLARELDGAWDWEGWLERRSGERLRAVAAGGLALMVSAVEPWQRPPQLEDALGAPAMAACRLPAERAHRLLAAPRHARANRAWFAELYPGPLLLLRAHSLLAGFPQSLRETRPVTRLVGPAVRG